MEQLPHEQEHLFHRDYGDIEKLASLGELLGGIAHELNSPVSAILGYAEMLQSPNVQEKSRDKYVQNIHGAALRASKIIDGLLTLLRKQKSELTTILVNNIIRKTVPLFEYQLRVKGISLVLNLESGLPFVQADFYKLQQVLFNLLMNAIQALESWGDEKRIVVSTHRAGQTVRMMIEDSGPGILPEHLDKIFMPFYTTKTHGTGLGLSIVQGIMKEHGGDISVESGTYGCRIILTLPAISDVAVCANDPDRAELPSRNRILIVDDDEMVVDTFCAMMEHVGYDVTFATSSADALAKLRSECFDLIFVDFRMPHMNGITFIEEALKCVEQEALVLITGDAGFREKEFSARFSVPVLHKPFDLDDMKLLMREHFKRKQDRNR